MWMARHWTASCRDKAALEKNRDYFNRPETWHELAALVPILDSYDRILMFEVMGDPLVPEDIDDIGKLFRFMDPEKSMVGRFCEEMIDYMTTWLHGGPKRKPWCLAEAMGAPMRCKKYQKQVRGFILLLNASVDRRYDRKYSSLPYTAHFLFHEKSLEGREKFHNDLRRADVSELDPYSLSLRVHFPEKADLEQPRVAAMIKCDFRSHPVCCDLIERQHTELSHKIVRRAPGRSFVTTAREQLMQQVCVQHCRRGGLHPLAPKRLSAGRNPMEAVTCNPLIHDSVMKLEHDGPNGGEVPEAATPSNASADGDSAMRSGERLPLPDNNGNDVLVVREPCFEVERRVYERPRTDVFQRSRKRKQMTAVQNKVSARSC